MRRKDMKEKSWGNETKNNVGFAGEWTRGRQKKKEQLSNKSLSKETKITRLEVLAKMRNR